MKVDGGCHCGNIGLRGRGRPPKVVICHCTDCQTLSGTAFRTVVPTSGHLKLLAGTPKAYVKTGESGNKRVQTFCADCGSPIYSGPRARAPKSSACASAPSASATAHTRATSTGSARRWPGSATCRASPSGTSNPCSTPRAASAAELTVTVHLPSARGAGLMRAGPAHFFFFFFCSSFKYVCICLQNGQAPGAHRALRRMRTANKMYR